MIFEADSIGKAFGGRRVLTAASLRAEAGKVTVLLGRNGAGKSTLLAIAAGRMAADYGVVRWAGRIHARPRLAHLAHEGLFYLPDRDLLEPGIAVGRQLAFAAGRFGRPPIDEVVTLLGLGEQLSIVPSRLPAGLLRRAEIAIALARRPLCLLADEPFRGVSPLDLELIVAALRNLAERGAAVVVTGHEVPALMAMADRVIWCVAGTTHEFLSAKAAHEDPQFQREYLGNAI